MSVDGLVYVKANKMYNLILFYTMLITWLYVKA